MSALVLAATAAWHDPVPACPVWEVADLMGHVVGVAADIASGNLAGAATDEWTEAQVRARRGSEPQALLEEWSRVAPGIEAALGPSGAQAVFDLATHEHDLRSALRRPGARRSDAVEVAVGWLAGWLPRRLEGAAGALVVEAGERRIEVEGPGQPTVLVLSPFELLRSVTGRRSRRQLEALPWQGPAQPFVERWVGPPFAERATDLVE